MTARDMGSRVGKSLVIMISQAEMKEDGATCSIPAIVENRRVLFHVPVSRVTQRQISPMDKQGMKVVLKENLRTIRKVMQEALAKRGVSYSDFIVVEASSQISVVAV